MGDPTKPHFHELNTATPERERGEEREEREREIENERETERET